MKRPLFKLKPGVLPVEQNGMPGLSLAGHIRFAKDKQQAALIRALAARAQPLQAMQTILSAPNSTSSDEAAAALTLAAFILDFEEYIEP